LSSSHARSHLRRLWRAASCVPVLYSGRSLAYIGALAVTLGAAHGAFAQIPAAPSGLSASGGLGQVSLAWTAVSGASSYTVKRSPATGGPYANVITGLTAPNFVNTGLDDGTPYYYVVSASNASGESPDSTQASAFTNTVSAPRNLTAAPGDTQALLTWTAVAGQGYNIYRSTTSGSGYTKINKNPLVFPFPYVPIATNAYIDTVLTNGTTYYYVVTYINAAGTESVMSSQASAVPLIQDTFWTMTRPPNHVANAPVVTTNGTAQTSALSGSSGATVMAGAYITGATTTALSQSASATGGGGANGTWTFHWTGSTWPTLYVVNRNQHKHYSATVSNGTGLGKVGTTGGVILATAQYPIVATLLTPTVTPTTTYDTSDLTRFIQTTTSEIHLRGSQTSTGTAAGAPISWTDSVNSVTKTQIAYTSQYFQSHFATPQSIVLIFAVPATTVTVAATLNNSTSAGFSSAQAYAGDAFYGK
jgi:fibronectin type 3 domain-containing protein